MSNVLLVTISLILLVSSSLAIQWTDAAAAGTAAHFSQTASTASTLAGNNVKNIFFEEHHQERLLDTEGQCVPPEEASCLYDGHHHQLEDGEEEDHHLEICVGVRGNGAQIFSHFTALARIVEELGPIKAAAGGSSATATIFFLESIQSNPLVVNSPCGDGHDFDNIDDNSNRNRRQKRTLHESEPDDRIRRARTSFLLKSLQQMDQYIDISNPFAEAGEIFKADIVHMDLINRLSMLGDNTSAIAFQELQDYVQNENFIGFVNPEFINLIFGNGNDETTSSISPDPIAHAEDIINALINFNFVVDIPSYFVRPTPLNLQAAITNHAKIGQFYSGYDPNVDMDQFEYMLEQCAVSGYGKLWDEIATKAIGVNETCGSLFNNLVEDYIETLEMNEGNNDNNPNSNLIQQPLGNDVMISLIAAGVIRDEGIDVYDAAKASYFEGNFDLTWEMNYDNIHVGYWGDQEVLDRAKVGIQKFDDLKSKTADFIGQGTWADLLIRSPGEPGLQNGVRGVDSMGEEYISIGGWVDLVPAQLLSAIGCENIILITKPSSAGIFQESVQTVLGATDEDRAQLNDLNSTTSAWTVALATADGTMCGNYDNACSNCTKEEKVKELGEIAWSGPFVSDDECLWSLYFDAPGLTGGIIEDYVLGCNAPLTTTATSPTMSPTTPTGTTMDPNITTTTSTTAPSSGSMVVSLTTSAAIVFTALMAIAWMTTP